jgi:2,3-bisphosphoglycerate-independent phosphoglycerate mutase
VFSDSGLKQLHIAETEKYAHVTFFLNGLIEKAFKGEERILVPSPDVTSYNQKPEMSAQEVTDEMLKAVKKDKFDFYAMNFANADMVGHTGDLKATVEAVETIDSVLSQIVPAVLEKNGVVFITADHGNAEQVVNPLNKEIDKEHNSYPVPFVIIGKDFEGKPNPELERMQLPFLTPVGVLSDVAPTILNVVGLDVPGEMTGRSLI